MIVLEIKVHLIQRFTWYPPRFLQNK